MQFANNFLYSILHSHSFLFGLIVAVILISQVAYEFRGAKRSVWQVLAKKYPLGFYDFSRFKRRRGELAVLNNKRKYWIGASNVYWNDQWFIVVPSWPFSIKSKAICVSKEVVSLSSFGLFIGVNSILIKADDCAVELKLVSRLIKDF